jgi:hypothetical protein
MKFISALILTAFLGFAIGLFTNMPWWSFIITAFLVALGVHQKPLKAFLSGFLGQFLLWASLACLKDMANDHLLSLKVAKIFPLGGSYWSLIFITGLIGGLVSGLAAIAGSTARKK